ncbi:stalk domain-containing protein [Paenibacillus alginolyticus]
MKNDSTLVPLRIITEPFGGNVRCDEKSRTVYLLIKLTFS